jgi:hypothetical protein
MKQVVTRQPGQPDPEEKPKSFFEMYWHYLVLFLVMMLIPMGDDGGQAGQAEGKGNAESKKDK